MSVPTKAIMMPRTGKDRLDHAMRIRDILEDHPYGLTINECVTEYYGNSPPIGEQLEFECEEVKRSIKYINQRFQNRDSGWVWIRTRRRPPNDWLYMAVAKMAAGAVVRIIDAAVSVETYERYERDWMTRTETLTRMEVLDIEARRFAALMSGDAESARLIESELDHLKIISPRLGLMYFGSGLVNENLEILENDPRARLINKQIKEVRHKMKQLEHSAARLGKDIEGLLGIRGVL